MTNYDKLRSELLPFGTDSLPIESDVYRSDSLVDPSMDWELAESALEGLRDSFGLGDDVIVSEVHDV